MTFPHILRLILAGILSLPALVLLACVAPLIALLSIPSLAIITRRKHRFFPCLNGGSRDAPHPLLQHAIITGGSSGIGLSVAIELAKRECLHITLIARREDQLKDAQRLVQQAAGSNSKTKVHLVSVDVTDFETLQKKAAQLCDTTKLTACDKRPPGPPTILFNCAGYSIPLSFTDLSHTDFAALMNVNYLGSVHVVKAFLPYMLRNKQNSNIGGNIILTSSMSGQVGSYGYSAYSPTKFALRGFAESLTMELDAANENQVNISLCYPPDTDTPGYEVENKKKPEACRLISESGGIWDPQVVGKKILREALSPNPPFDIYFGLEGWMLSTITAGMNPVNSAVDAICQVALMGLLRLISLYYLMDFGRITQNCEGTKKNGIDELKTD